MKNNEIFVWDVNWIDYLAQKDKLYLLLSPYEQHRAQQYRFERHRNRFIVTRAILRLLIADLTSQTPHSLVFEYTGLGKPKLSHHEGLYFSVSHSKHKTLYAFCKQPDVGIDIEYQRPLDINRLAGRYFSTQENQLLKSLNPQQKQVAFFQGWTQKEAITKALGLGLQLPFNQIEVKLTASFPGVSDLPIPFNHPEHWYLKEIKMIEHFKAIVAVKSLQPIIMHSTKFTRLDLPIY